MPGWPNVAEKVGDVISTLPQAVDKFLNPGKSGDSCCGVIELVDCRVAVSQFIKIAANSAGQNLGPDDFVSAKEIEKAHCPSCNRCLDGPRNRFEQQRRARQGF